MKIWTKLNKINEYWDWIEYKTCDLYWVTCVTNTDLTHNTDIKLTRTTDIVTSHDVDLTRVKLFLN